MPIIVTRMPSTGRVTTIGTGYGTIEEVRERWADNPNVTVYTEEEFDALPRCGNCGCIDGDPRCQECRW
jgi:hypothetical protein